MLCEHGSPAVVGDEPLDRILCEPGFRTGVPFQFRISIR